jgi:site-specific DNA recombinase
MQVALYARVSTPHQQQEGTIVSQVRLLRHYVHQQGWSLLPDHEYLDEGISGARLDRPALDRLRDSAQRGEFDAVVVLSPDRLARNYAHQWLLIEELAKYHTQVVFLQNPFGDTPQGKLLTQMQGMIAEYERAQILERTRRGRLEKARRGELIPWAYRCYGYRYLPKRPSAPPQVVIEPDEAAVVRYIYRLLVEEHLSCRQITKRLNESRTPTPSGYTQVWHPATVRRLLTNRAYAGRARYNARQSVVSQSRPQEAERLDARTTGRRYRPETEWVWSDAPAIIAPELFDKAQVQLQRNAELAQKLYQPTSCRYLLRRLVKCGECGLSLMGTRQRSVCKKYEYLYYECKGHAPLTCGRPHICPSRRVRADRLDAVVWQALSQLLQRPAVIPRLHQTWARAKQQHSSALAAQRAQLSQRRQRLERQSQRLLDAYQAEIISLNELQTRRRKLSAEVQQIAQECEQLDRTQHQTKHWQQVIEHATTFRRLLGTNLDRLSFEERQAVAHCLISKVVVTGEQVDISYVLPFEGAPQVTDRLGRIPEGTPGHFYRLRLAHLDWRAHPIQPADLGGRQCEAVGGIVLGAVSDDQDVQATSQPAGFRPIGGTPIGSEGLAIAAAMRLQAAHNVPSIIPKALQQGFRGVPGVEQHIRRAATPPMASVAEPLQGQPRRGGAPLGPQPYTPRDSHAPLRPDQDHGEAIHRLALSAGEDPGQALHGRCEGFRDRVINDERPPFPNEPWATGALQECVPGPVGLQHSRPAVMGHGLQGQGHTRGRCAIIQPGGEVEPNQRWHRVPSCVMVGWELYPISPLLRNT